MFQPPTVAMRPCPICISPTAAFGNGGTVNMLTAVTIIRPMKTTKTRKYRKLWKSCSSCWQKRNKTVAKTMWAKAEQVRAVAPAETIGKKFPDCRLTIRWFPTNPKTARQSNKISCLRRFPMRKKAQFPLCSAKRKPPVPLWSSI